jgi:hypothetical protein
MQPRSLSAARRHCEERSDEATQELRHAAPGLLRNSNPKQPVIQLILLDKLRTEKRSTEAYSSYGRRPECTEKRRARFIQGDRPEAGAEPAMTARENYGYFFPNSDYPLGSKLSLSGSLLRDESVVYRTAS